MAESPGVVFMVTRRGAKPEAVTHEALMDRLDQIDARLSAGNRRFGEFELAIKPVSDLIEAVGGEEQFQELVIDAARGLASLAWLGRKLKRLLVLVTVIGGAITAVIGMAKVIFWDFGKGG